MRPCRRTLSVRSGTIFESWRRFSLEDLFKAIYLWANKLNVTEIQRLTGLPKKAVIKMGQILRQVCRNSLGRNPIRLGGGGFNFVVQVDETQAHHRQRVKILISFII